MIAHAVHQPTDTSRVRRSLGFGVLAIATLVAWAPLASLLTGVLLTTALGCQGNEGSLQPCVVAGMDVGSFLNVLTLAGWLILGVWPLMLLTLLVWCGVFVWMIVRRFRGHRLGNAR